MSEYISRGRKARRCYGFDEIALVPGTVSIDPNDVDVSWTMGDMKIEVPILTSVAPSSIATSKSVDIPIESSSRHTFSGFCDSNPSLSFLRDIK